jgi:putative intracellular protease/amidase
LEEFAAPYYVFRDAGADITLASPKGGQPPVDPRSEEPAAQTPATNLLKQKAAQPLLADTARLSTVAAVYDAVFYPGGHGPLWDWPRIASPSG